MKATTTQFYRSARPFARRFIFATTLALAFAAGSIRAATLYWSGNGTTLGGPGTWNTTVAHWGTSTNGPFDIVWSNANSDTPNIGYTAAQTGGSLVIGANITIKNDLMLNPASGGYTLDGSSTLTFNAGSALNVPDVTSYRSINCKYAGTITKTGLGRVSFNNASSSAIKYIMKEGIAQFSAANRYGTAADSPDFLTLDGGTLQFDFLQPWTQGKSMTITANGGTLDGTSALVITQDKPVASSGNGTLTVDTITLILTSPANTFTNQLTFIGGKLQLGASDRIPNGNIVVLNGGDMDMAGFNQTLKNIVVRNASSALTGAGTLTVTNLIDLRANSGNLSTVMAGPAKATKTGTTTVTVTGFNTYTGGLTMSAGVFRVGSGQPFGTGPLTLTAGTVQGNSGTARTLSMPVLLNGDVTLGSPTNAANLTFQTGAWTNNANHTLTVDTVTATINSVIKEDAPGRSLTKAGTGTLALNGNNTYTGDTTVNAGVVSINGTVLTPFGIGGTLTLAGTTLNTTASRAAGSTGLANPLTLTADSAITTTGTAATVDLELSSDAINVPLGTTLTVRNDAASGSGVFQPFFSGSFDLPGNVAVVNGAFGTTRLQSGNTNGTADQILDGVISGTGGYVRTGKANGGGGTAILNGANTYTGGTEVNAGTLKLGNSAALGATATTYLLNQSPATVLKAGALDLNGQTISRPITMSGGQLINSSTTPATVSAADGAVQAVTFTSGGSGVSAGTTVVFTGGGGSDAAATISFALTPASLTLASGGTGYKNNDVLTVADGGGTGAKITVNSTNAGDGAILTWTLSAAGKDFTSAPTTVTGGTGSGASFNFNPDNFTVVSVTTTAPGSGYTTEPAVTLSSGSGFTGQAVLSSSVRLNAMGSIGGSDDITMNALMNGAGGFTKTGAGTLVLPRSNSYAGGTVVSGGTLDVQQDGALGSGNVTVATGAALTLELGTANSYIAASANLAVASGAVVNLNFSGVNTINALSFDGGLNFQAAGTWGAPGSGATHTDTRFTGTGILNVTLDGSVVTIASSLNPAVYGQSITFTSTVAALTLPGTPTGTVTFKDGTAVLGTVALDGSGVATFSTNRLTAGVRSITAAYNGDSTFAPGVSSTLLQTNSQVTVTPTITVDSKVYDGATSCLISSRSLSGALSGDDVSLGSSGTATFADPNVGTAKPVTVAGLTLSGTTATNYVLSTTSASLTTDITAAASTTSLSSSQNPSTNGISVTFTATVSSTAGAPTGNVVFLSDSVPFSTNALVSGQAQASTASLAAGTRTIAAQYAAQANWLASDTNMAQVVQSGGTCSATNALLGVTDNLDGTFTLSFQGTYQAAYCVVTNSDATAPIGAWGVLTGSSNTVTDGSGLWSLIVTNVGGSRFYRSQAINPCSP